MFLNSHIVLSFCSSDELIDHVSFKILDIAYIDATTMIAPIMKNWPFLLYIVPHLELDYIWLEHILVYHFYFVY